MTVVVLAGGTGGAKLAAGAQDLCGDQLSVIANTGDDVDVLGVHVSPDPDLVTYWLCDEIDEERGWGIRGDTFTVFERLVELGGPAWFALSDRDMATCLRRTELVRKGARLTEAQAEIASALGATAAVLPMCDERVHTRVRTSDGWRDFQQYLVLEHAEPEIEQIEIVGLEHAAVTREARDALAGAEAIVVGPSNPVISIGPILAVPGMRDLLAASPAPVVAVSPFVAGKVIKGPTDKFMRAIDQDPSTTGVAAAYEGVIDGLVIDADDPEPPPAGVESVSFPTLMSNATSRREVAERTLEFARSLAG